VAQLRAQGLRTLMLSGDRREAALAVAAAVGIPESDVHAGVKPAGKAALVESLRASGRRVAMVGDGVNDTAALAAADVGVAMAGGVDAASDVASIVLMGDQLHQVWFRVFAPPGGAWGPGWLRRAAGARLCRRGRALGSPSQAPVGALTGDPWIAAQAGPRSLLRRMTSGECLAPSLLPTATHAPNTLTTH
jgi:hypothetical protein